MPATTTTTAAVAAELTASLRAHLDDLSAARARPYPGEYVLAFRGHPLFYAEWNERGDYGRTRHSAGSILKAYRIADLGRAIKKCEEITNGDGSHPMPELWAHAIEREEWSVREAIEMIERAAAARDDATR